MTKVKICGITNLEDALVSAKFGADALGFNFYAKSPRYIAPDNAREIIEQLPENILKVGVFVNESLEKIAAIAETARLDALQLHGEETPEFARALKKKTDLEIIKAFRVSPDFKPEDVLLYDTEAILLDAYNPHEHGGTGETFDWEIARRVQKVFPKMYLAGGLKDANVSRAIKNVRPFAIDVCSGIESRKGKKDKVRLINLITKAKNSLRAIRINDIYDLFAAIQVRPALFLGKNSLSHLRVFLDGFTFSVKHHRKKFDFKKFNRAAEQDFNDDDYFTGFVAKYFNESVGGMAWNSIILEKNNGDEEKSLDVFFALLEEFKLEKEDLSDE